MEMLVMMSLLIGCLIQGVLCDFTISLPDTVEARQGSCVFIPCTFDIDNQYNNDLTVEATRKWFNILEKNDPVFDSRNPLAGPLKGEIFGTATEKNCTAHFDNVSQSNAGEYYFRLETSGALKYNYKNNTEKRFKTLSIAVRESPPEPAVSLSVDQQELTEGSSVTLICSTEIFCPLHPPVLTWSSSPEHLLDESVRHQSQTKLKFTVTHRHHGATFTCSATHQQQEQITTHASLTLHVQYAPKNTSVHVDPPGLVLKGRSVTLSCSSDANPPVNYTWYRNTDPRPAQTGENLTISSTDPTHSGQYRCTAQNPHGTQNTSVLLDVQSAPTVSSSCAVGSVITCVCEAHGNPSPTLEWRQSGHILTNSTRTLVRQESFGDVGLKSFLSISQSLTDTAVLQCFSVNTHGSASHQLQLHSPSPPTDFHHPSLFLGAAVSTSTMMILCLMFVCYGRRRTFRPSGDETSGLFRTQRADKESTAAEESLHYSSIDFSDWYPVSGEIRGTSSLTSEYAVIQHQSAGDTEQRSHDRTEEKVYKNFTHH